MNKKYILIPFIVLTLVSIVFGIYFWSIKGTGKTLDDYLDLGSKYLQEQDYDKAITAFEKALEIDSKCVEAYIGLAEAYEGIGDIDKAIEVLEKGYSETKHELVKIFIDKYKKEQENLIKTEEAEVDEKEEGEEIEEIIEEENALFDYDELGVTKYNYPDDSQGLVVDTGALAMLAGMYDRFDENSVYNDDYKRIFIGRFLQNSIYDFEYRYDISMTTNEITEEQLEYIQYSLTGVYLDFTSEEANIDLSNCGSPSEIPELSVESYSVSEDGTEVDIDALLCEYQTVYNDELGITNYNCKIKLKKDPYSCFAGYNVVSIEKNFKSFQSLDSDYYYEVE